MQKRVDLIKEYGDNARLNVDKRTETFYHYNVDK